LPWWLLLLLIAFLSWIFVNSTVYFYFEYLGDLINTYEQPPQNLIERWENDGGKRVFALAFGWAYGLIYSLPWLMIYGIINLIKKWNKRKNLSEPVAPLDRGPLRGPGE